MAWLVRSAPACQVLAAQRRQPSRIYRKALRVESEKVDCLLRPDPAPTNSNNIAPATRPTNVDGVRWLPPPLGSAHLNPLRRYRHTAPSIGTQPEQYEQLSQLPQLSSITSFLSWSSWPSLAGYALPCCALCRAALLVYRRTLGSSATH